MSSKLVNWFREEILPVAVKNGHFSENGEQQEIVSCEFEEIKPGVSNFASFPGFAKLTLKTTSGTTSYHILVKFQALDPIFREKMKTVPQFRNETVMYTQVLRNFVKFLEHNNKNPDIVRKVVPKCYFAQFCEEDPEKSVVVLDDLRQTGFKLTESVTELDLKHCLVALESLAQFHAVSYAMKFSKWEPFEDLKKSFVHVWLADEPTAREHFEKFKILTAQRGIDYLLKNKDMGVPEEYLKNLKKILEPIFEFIRNIHSPVEPISVICHGDFNRNNLLFRYSNGEVSDAKLIDFQTSLYSSPSIDLTFFVYMNTTLEFREKYFDLILNHYYTTLVKTVSDILNTTESSVVDLIPFQALKDDFGRVAINAYVLISFFLPFMEFPPNTDFAEDFKTKTFEEMAWENIELGGETASKKIAEVIVDFYRRKFYM